MKILKLEMHASASKHEWSCFLDPGNLKLAVGSTHSPLVMNPERFKSTASYRDPILSWASRDQNPGESTDMHARAAPPSILHPFKCEV